MITIRSVVGLMATATAMAMAMAMLMVMVSCWSDWSCSSLYKWRAAVKTMFLETSTRRDAVHWIDEGGLLFLVLSRDKFDPCRRRPGPSKQQ